jgi:hypothetical protein
MEMKPGFDNRNHEKLIRDTIKAFYQAYYNGDKLTLYSCLDTGFQRRFPLNYFLIHERFGQDLGRLLEIRHVYVYKENNTACAEVVVEEGGERNIKEIKLLMDYGGWKISGDIFSS